MLKRREIFYFTYLILRRLARWKCQASGAEDSRLLVWPPIETSEELEDILAWIAWYLPQNSGFTVSLVCAPDLVVRYGRVVWGHVKLFSEVSGEKIDTFLIRKDTLRNCLKTLMRFNARVECIDKEFFSYHEPLAFQRLYALRATRKLLDMGQRLAEASQRNYECLYRKYKGCRRAFVLGTGPSIQEIFNVDIGADDLVIACNSVIKNQPVLDHTRPAVVAFADPVFHFGRSAYARAFREQLINAIGRTNFVCVVPPEHGLLLALHYPELITRLIILPATQTFNFPTPDDMTVKVTGNIMTLYMLPIASAMAQEVYVVGADGQVAADNYFWKHDRDSQFVDLMQTVVDTHPSFFRDTDYRGYFRNHCSTMEATMSEGEERGVKYYSVTRSTVPALRRRPSTADVSRVEVVDCR